MSIVNTENPNEKTYFENAVLNSLPSYNGLWFPEKINKLPDSFFDNIHNLTFDQIAFIVLKNLCRFKLTDEKLKQVIKKAFNFPIHQKKLNNNIYIFETFHGPTYTFKDFGARFLASYLEEYLSDSNEKYNVLVSTSGDTGSAIASAFYKIPNIKVTILYPKNRVSQIQEIQMTTFGNNIATYSIRNNFDQCQSMVKKAFIDKDIKINLISANSINLGRLLPQSIYYFYSYALLKKSLGGVINRPVLFSVPCGNCGNLTGGLIAKKMGLDVKFIACQNKNSVFIDYLKTGEYKSIISEKTYSSAMEVGNPSNVKRIDYLYNNNVSKMSSDIKTNFCSEITTAINMRHIWEQFGYMADPHTAVGYNGAIQSLQSTNKNSIHIVISTASPIKFRYTVTKAIGIFPKLTKDLELLTQKPNYSINLENNYDQFVNNLNKTGNKNCSITLIGMPGTGKTVVSEKIAKYNNSYNLLELDRLITSTHGASLFTLIEKYGEDKFKQLEENAILSIDFSKKNIISTGGSVVYCDKGMQYLKNKNNFIVYLDTQFDILETRTENFTNRGIVFNGLTPRELYNERDLLYKKYADVTIKCKDLSIKTISKIILGFLN